MKFMISHSMCFFDKVLSLNLTVDDLLAGSTSSGTQKTFGARTYCTNLSGGIFTLINFEIMLESFHHCILIYWTSCFCRLRGFSLDF